MLQHQQHLWKNWFQGIIEGDVCDLPLVVFGSRISGSIVGDEISSVDINGSGDKGCRWRVRVFGCKNCPMVSGSFILLCISEV